MHPARIANQSVSARPVISENRRRYLAYSNAGLALKASFVAPARTSLLSISFN